MSLLNKITWALQKDKKSQKSQDQKIPNSVFSQWIETTALD